MTDETIPLLLDVDTGIDDALALLYAVRHPRLDLRAVGCVAGNTRLEHVVRNTLAVLSVAGADDVPVAAGHACPLLGEPVDAGGYHGADGLLGVRVDAPERVPTAGHAVDLLRTTVMASTEPVVLCPLGPLTDVAVLLRTYPEVLDRMVRVQLMGGSGTGGNMTAAAEFNVFCDPEAAAVVLGSGGPTWMYGLDVFDRVVVVPEQIHALLAADHPAPRLAGRLLAAVVALRPEQVPTLGDAGAVAALCRPEMVTFVPRRVVVDTGRGPGRGQTIVDRRGDPGEADPGEADPGEAGPGEVGPGSGTGALVHVAETVDGVALAQHVVDVLLTGQDVSR